MGKGPFAMKFTLRLPRAAPTAAAALALATPAKALPADAQWLFDDIDRVMGEALPMIRECAWARKEAWFEDRYMIQCRDGFIELASALKARDIELKKLLKRKDLPQSDRAAIEAKHRETKEMIDLSIEQAREFNNTIGSRLPQ